MYGAGNIGRGFIGQLFSESDYEVVFININTMLESLKLMSGGIIKPSSMITHIEGLNSVVNATLNLPKIPGGKKLIYTNIDLDLTVISDFRERGKTDKLNIIKNNLKGV